MIVNSFIINPLKLTKLELLRGISDMTRRYQRTFLDRYTPLFFVMWLLYTMNSILQWYSFGVIFRGIGFLGIVLYSLSNQKNK